MADFVALLRGINVSGKNVIRMAELQESLDGIGLTHVRTYLQSGNVIFQSANRDTMKLAKLIHDCIAHDYTYDVDERYS